MSDEPTTPGVPPGDGPPNVTSSPMALAKEVLDAMQGMLTGNAVVLAEVTAKADLILRMHRADPKEPEALKAASMLVSHLQAVRDGLTYGANCAWWLCTPPVETPPAPTGEVPPGEASNG